MNSVSADDVDTGQRKMAFHARRGPAAEEDDIAPLAGASGISEALFKSLDTQTLDVVQNFSGATRA